MIKPSRTPRICMGPAALAGRGRVASIHSRRSKYAKEKCFKSSYQVKLQSDPGQPGWWDHSNPLPAQWEHWLSLGKDFAPA